MARFFILFLFFLVTCVFAYSPNSEREIIEERIKPIGVVNIEKDSNNPAPATAKKTTPPTEEPGQVIYERHCIICHKDGIAGAPLFRDEAAWKPRISAGGLDALIASAMQGKNAMPVKGTCQECSDSDIKAAIQYMLPKK